MGNEQVLGWAAWGDLYGWTVIGNRRSVAGVIDDQGGTPWSAHITRLRGVP